MLSFKKLRSCLSLQLPYCLLPGKPVALIIGLGRPIRAEVRNVVRARWNRIRTAMRMYAARQGS